MEDSPQDQPQVTRNELIVTTGSLAVGFTGIALNLAEVVPEPAKKVVASAAIVSLLAGTLPLRRIWIRDHERQEQADTPDC